MPLPKAWPFDEAARLAARLAASGQGRGPVRDRLRPVRPAAYRHLRRGGAHHLGAPRLHRADRPALPAARLQRRHGRAAQGAGQRAEPGDAGRLSRPAADPHARPVRHPSRASARTTTPGCAPSWTVSASNTSSPPAPNTTQPAGSTPRCSDGGAARRDRRASSCRRSGRSGGPPTRRSCRSIRAPAGSCRCRIDRVDAAAGTIAWQRPRERRAVRDLGHRRRLQAAMEGRLGDALVRARRRLRDVRQGPDRQRAAVRPDLPRPRRRSRRWASPTSCSSTSTARRSARARATACRSRNGCATRRPRAWRSSCTTRRSGPSGCIFDVIPRAVDEYLANAAQAARAAAGRALANPAWHIHGGAQPRTAAQPGVLRHAAQPRQRGERRDAGHAVGLHPPLQPGGHARRPCRSSTGWWSTPSPTTGTSCARRSATAQPDASRARGAAGPRARRCAACRPGADAEAIQNVRVRGRQAPPLPRPARLVRLPVSGAAGPAGGAALRRVRRAVWRRRDDRADRGARSTVAGATPPDAATDAGGERESCLRHLPAVLGVVLLVGAIYVVRKEFRHLKIADIARRARTRSRAARW